VFESAGDAATDPRSFFRYRDFCKDVSRLEALKYQGGVRRWPKPGKQNNDIKPFVNQPLKQESNKYFAFWMLNV